MNVGELKAFQFERFQDYFAVLNRQTAVRRGKKATLSEWAKKLGYRSPRTVGMVLTGKRLPSPELISRLSALAGLNNAEHRYFELLVELERRTRRGRSVEDVVAQIRRFQSSVPKRVILKADIFAFLSDWYCLVIKQLLEGPSGKEDPLWIRRRLRNKVTLTEIRSALATMERLGLFYRDEKGTLHSSRQAVTTEADTLMEAGKNHHLQMLERAKEAIQEEPQQWREVDSKTFRMNPKKMKQAKERLRRWRDDFLDEFYDESSDEVFQLNFQLFKHTEES